jgi:hypothetical protein
MCALEAFERAIDINPSIVLRVDATWKLSELLTDERDSDP